MHFTFRKGTLQDAEAFILFLEEVKAGMQQKEWFYLDPPDRVRSWIADGTMEFWLSLAEERLAAVFSILHPGLKEDNYGYDLGLCEEELHQVVHMDTAAVHPDYRGFRSEERV